MHFPRVAALNEQMTETKKKYFLMFLVRFSNSLFSEFIGKRAPVVGNTLKENYRIIYTTNIICYIIHFFLSEISTAYPDCNILKRARKSYLKYLWKEKENQEFYGWNWR